MLLLQQLYLCIADALALDFIYIATVVIVSVPTAVADIVVYFTAPHIGSVSAVVAVAAFVAAVVTFVAVVITVAVLADVADAVPLLCCSSILLLFLLLL